MRSKVSLIGLAAFAGIVFLSGCATPIQIEENDPAIEAFTDKSPDDYVRCVAPKWQDITPLTNVSPAPDGWRLVTPHPLANADDVLVITEAEGGSDIRLHHRVHALRQNYRDAVLQCI